VTSIVGDFYAWVRSNSFTELSKLKLGTTIEFRAYSFGSTNYVLATALEPSINSIILFGSTITDADSSIQYLDYINLEKKIFFTSICDRTSHQGADMHNAYWQSNVNVFNVSVDYDKPYLGHLLRLNTNKSFGDGMCAYNIYARSISEFADLRIIGSDYGFPGYNTLDSESYYVSGQRKSHSGGNSVTMTGMFVNSCGKTIILNNASDTGI
jgi:hypothetical protein